MDETYARILTTKTQEAKNGAILSLWYTDPNTGEERYRIAWDYRVPIARLYDGQNKLGEYSYLKGTKFSDTEYKTLSLTPEEKSIALYRYKENANRYFQWRLF